MNASQRRKAYRKIASMAGRKAVWQAKDGRTIGVTIKGLTEPVMNYSHPIGYNYDGNRPSVNRVRVHRDSNVSTKSTFGAKLSQLRFIA